MRALPFRIRFNPAITGSHRFRNCLVTLGAGAILVTCCYFWIDRSLALWVNAHQSHFVARDDFNPIARIPNPAVLVSLVLFFLFGFSQLAKRRLNHLEQVALASSTSVLVGETAKDVFKWVFGRASPDIWATNNSAATGFQEYQFHWFHGIEPFNSFPSGHMTAITAVTAILWMEYPRFRPIYTVCGLTVAAGLVAFNFHFLGDVIAGAFLGTTVGLFVFSSLLGQSSERL